MAMFHRPVRSFQNNGIIVSSYLIRIIYSDYIGVIKNVLVISVNISSHLLLNTGINKKVKYIIKQRALS